MNYDQDQLLREAKFAFREAGRGSTSLLQRKLRIGYGTAIELMSLLEKEGFIGERNGTKPRELL